MEMTGLQSKCWTPKQNLLVVLQKQGSDAVRMWVPQIRSQADERLKASNSICVLVVRQAECLRHPGSWLCLLCGYGVKHCNTFKAKRVHGS